MTRSRLVLGALWPSMTCALAVTGGCSSESSLESMRGGPGSGGDASVSGAADSEGTPIDDGPPALPTAACGSALPGSFTSTCSACHTASGAANSRYPDLFQYAGTLDEFKTQVRTGKGNMPAFAESLIADADLEAIYGFFTASERGAVELPTLDGIEPLFGPADVVNLPIVFTRDDGALVTRGAGRVRGRHEGPLDTNQPFQEWVEDYFQSRTYGWLVEDFTPTGESRIRVSYLPNTVPTGNTNFRAWKIYDNGDVFNINDGMATGAPLPGLSLGGVDLAGSYQASIAPYAEIQQAETTSNVREGRPIQAGDLFEFEFGIFFDGGSIQPPGSRTAYYTDTFRYKVSEGGVTANNPDSYQGDIGATAEVRWVLGPVEEAQLGGGTTSVWHFYLPETYFGQMALNIQHENVQNFVEGRRLFHTDFASGEHSEAQNDPFVEQAGKAGPLLATTSCENCHVNNGAGRLLDGPIDETSSMAFKLYDAGELGNQLQLQEGTASVASTLEKTVMLGDGSSVVLKKPVFAVTPNDGSSPAFSARIARKLIGMGLLEAIPEETILGRADMLDCDGNGISGRPSFIADPVSGVTRVGRMGWKAEKVDVRHQIADALDADIGVTTSILPGPAGVIELADADLSDLTTYMRLIAVPGQRDHDDPQVAQGEELFKTIGCANCHVTDAVTGANHPFAELRSQSIKPFTDLLLHDLGEDLADDSRIAVPAAGDGNSALPAGASEWRTAPLWGVGLLAIVNGNTGLLHDGRAASVLEAVLWHGGEAEAVKQRVVALSSADREALIRFVESL
jgi:CxxC motif-containing protein (DUF1111 family)/cytochrome c553